MSRIDSKHLAALKSNIANAEVIDLDDALGDLDDVGGVADWDDQPILFSTLPVVVPAELRREIATMSAQHVALGKKIQAVLDDITQRIEDAAADKEEKELAAKPRCECCNQPLPKTRKIPRKIPVATGRGKGASGIATRNVR